MSNPSNLGDLSLSQNLGGLYGAQQAAQSARQQNAGAQVGQPLVDQVGRAHNEGINVLAGEAVADVHGIRVEVGPQRPPPVPAQQRHGWQRVVPDQSQRNQPLQGQDQPIQGQNGAAIQGQPPVQGGQAGQGSHIDNDGVGAVNNHTVDSNSQKSDKSARSETFWKVVEKVAIPVLMVIGFVALAGAVVAAFVPPFGIAASLGLIAICAVAWGGAGLLSIANSKYGTEAAAGEQKAQEDHVDNQINQNNIEYQQLIANRSEMKASYGKATTPEAKAAIKAKFEANEEKIEKNRGEKHNLQTQLNNLRGQTTEAAKPHERKTVDGPDGNEPAMTRDQLNSEIADLKYELEQNTDPTKAKGLQAKINAKNVKLADLIESGLPKLKSDLAAIPEEEYRAKAAATREINIATSEARQLRMSVLDEEASGLMNDINSSYEQYAAAKRPGGLKKEDGTPMPETTRRVIESFEKKLEAASAKINNLDDLNENEEAYLKELKEISPDIDGKIQDRIDRGGNLSFEKIPTWNLRLTQIRRAHNIREQAPLQREEQPVARQGQPANEDIVNPNIPADTRNLDRIFEPRGNLAPQLGRIRQNQPRQNIADVNFDAPERAQPPEPLRVANPNRNPGEGLPRLRPNAQRNNPSVQQAVPNAGIGSVGVEANEARKRAFTELKELANKGTNIINEKKLHATSKDPQLEAIYNEIKDNRDFKPIIDKLRQQDGHFNDHFDGEVHGFARAITELAGKLNDTSRFTEDGINKAEAKAQEMLVRLERLRDLKDKNEELVNKLSDKTTLSEEDRIDLVNGINTAKEALTTIEKSKYTTVFEIASRTPNEISNEDCLQMMNSLKSINSIIERKTS